MLRRSLPLLAAVLPLFACEVPESTPPSSSRAAVLQSLLDAETEREVVLGKAFSPDGSIQAADRTESFAPGTPILLSVESGDLAAGTRVKATWTAPNGTTAVQESTTIGGESYLTYTAPSTDWPEGVGQLLVRIEKTGGPSGKVLRFEVSASARIAPTPKPTPAPGP
ncbi:MAG TPA: hypothetical protein VN851_21090 [Thermoanaerobaculia bacterium]|nr:hypothetical protein [Thermoanaerobaculia bacterium]